MLYKLLILNRWINGIEQEWTPVSSVFIGNSWKNRNKTKIHGATNLKNSIWILYLIIKIFLLHTFYLKNWKPNKQSHLSYPVLCYKRKEFCGFTWVYNSNYEIFFWFKEAYFKKDLFIKIKVFTSLYVF